MTNIMLQTKLLPIVFFITTFLVGFFSGRWSSEDTSNHAELADNLLHSSFNTEPDRPSVNLLPNTTTENRDTIPISTAAEEVQKLETKLCNQACVKQLLKDLFQQQNNEEFSDTDRYSGYIGQIIQGLIDDPDLFSEYARDLIDQIALSPTNGSQNEETLLGIAHALPEGLRTGLAREMMQSHPNPKIVRIALGLLPNDPQLHIDAARIAIQNVLSDGSEESIMLLQHIVNLGGDLSESTVAVDLEYYQKTLQDPVKRRTSLGLLTQINPDSQALKDSLAASLDSEPHEIFSALNAIVALSQNSDGDQSAGQLISANRERIQALANDSAAPLYVRIESMQLLMMLDNTAERQ